MEIIKFGNYIKIVFSGIVIFSLLNSCSGETFETAINDYQTASQKPKISSLTTPNNTTLYLSFDVNLDGNSAKNANFSIIDQNGTSLPINSLQTGEKSVTLTTDSQQNQNYTVKVSGIKSANTVEMESYSGIFSGDALPEIVNVSSNSNNGVIYSGQEILIQIEFSEEVDISGIPSLLMNTGTDSNAIYTSGSGTNILTFSYIVNSGDSNSNLDITSLSLNGGSIIDFNQNANPNLSVPTPGEIGSLSYNNPLEVNSTEFSISDVAVNEGGGSAIVTIAKTGTSPGGTSVDYATSDNTATAPSDYTATSGTLSWTATETGDKTFSILINNDSVIETDEAFTVTISNPVNATIINSTATVTIIENDDVPPALTSVSIISDNTDTIRAKVGDTVTISFTADEAIQAPPTVTIDGNPATIGGTDPDYTASYTLQTGDTEGVVHSL